MATSFGHKRDLAETTISATVDGSTTSITVDSASAVTPTGGWPTRGLVWNRSLYPNPRDDAARELVVITGATGDVLTVTRASSPHTHAVGDVLVLVDSADDWEAVFGAINALEAHPKARLLGSNPLDATPGNRPAGDLYDLGFYSGAVYICTSASTPTWVRVGPA